VSKECLLEKQLAPIMRKLVGMYMEFFVANEVYCPRCNNKTLESLGTHAPSLDLICKSCKTKYEIKSKCMSADIIPVDLVFNHGNYYDYINRQRQGLDIILIIYSVNRKTKVIKIRKVLWVPHNQIIESNIINVIKKQNSTLSQIVVDNYKYLNEICFVNQKFAYDFSENINTIINSHDIFIDNNSVI
jgi:transcription elongation factor Elf1